MEGISSVFIVSNFAASYCDVGRFYIVCNYIAAVYIDSKIILIILAYDTRTQNQLAGCFAFTLSIDVKRNTLPLGLGAESAHIQGRTIQQ